MDGSICLTEEERKILLKWYRGGDDVRLARRAHVLLLLDDGQSYRFIQQVTYASFDLIAGCVRRYQHGGVNGLTSDDHVQQTPWWLYLLLHFLQERTPQDFGYFRCRWTCDMLREVLAWEAGERVSRETIRRTLKQLAFVWRRPRPIVGPVDPEYGRKLRRIRELLKRLRQDETALFEDEVDVNLNPKIGACWMPRGQQAEVVTPGNNVKRHLAGSLIWRTGTLIVSSPGAQRNAKLFVEHLDDLRRRLRSYRLIHVICDNASFHTCRAVQDYLNRWKHRIQLHFLPKYAPETNPIERVWWHMHETVTRNHRCSTMDELLERVHDWLNAQSAFRIEDHRYRRRFKAA